MDDAAFDRALVSAAFALAAQVGWRKVSVTEAARRGGLPLDRARGRFPGRAAVLVRFGRIADQTALADVVVDPASSPRDRLFDLLMRRFDALQANRDGVLALLATVPFNPMRAMLLGMTTLGSMAWMLEAAGISAQGPIGRLRAKALTAVWVQAVRAWAKDDSPDLSGTMAALDKTLGQADRMAAWLPAGRREAAAMREAGAGEPGGAQADDNQADDSHPDDTQPDDPQPAGTGLEGSMGAANARGMPGGGQAPFPPDAPAASEADPDSLPPVT